MDELPPSAAISKTLPESARVVYTNHVFPSEKLRGSVKFEDTPTFIKTLFLSKMLFLGGIMSSFMFKKLALELIFSLVTI